MGKRNVYKGVKVLVGMRYLTSLQLSSLRWSGTVIRYVDSRLLRTHDVVCEDEEWDCRTGGVGVGGVSYLVLLLSSLLLMLSFFLFSTD